MMVVINKSIEFHWCFDESVLKWFCRKAVNNYGDYEQACFTNASFSNVVMEELKLKQPVDGNIVRMILIGRPWLRQIDCCQYQIILPQMANLQERINDEPL